ncbi:MAG: hypothetical protein JW936_10705 [Sedimentisphaerales bacterium]|nr:hypothetical protein [Sedimentisphaerales bacterium]
MGRIFRVLILLVVCLVVGVYGCRSGRGDPVRSVIPETLRLPSVLTSGAVLQRDMPIHIWGWDVPGTLVTVELAGNAVSARADDEGRFSVYLPSLAGGGPYSLRVAGTTTITLDDILMGEVWVCSGQSNMEWPVRNSNNGGQEIADADFRRIRILQVPNRSSVIGQDDVDANWQVCSSDTIGGFSAVGYFFGRNLHQSLNVPIGLIDSTIGGTAIEGWISLEGFQSEPQCSHLAEEAVAMGQDNDRASDGARGPTSYFNGMIAPLTGYPIAGVIWYQGESNAGNGYFYRTLMPLLIRDWRSHWQQDEMPFLLVQLANFGPDEPMSFAEARPGASGWAQLREAQSMTVRDTANTGMAVAIDVGDATDIHPRDKQEVGYRLALAARAVAYGQDIIYSGPIYDHMRIEGSTIRIYFDHTAEGLVAKDGALLWFAIAGEDREFFWAEATIEGKTVVVRCDEVANPVAVRYAWANNPQGCNLYNTANLPASPFRTDDWGDGTP